MWRDYSKLINFCFCENYLCNTLYMLERFLSQVSVSTVYSEPIPGKRQKHRAERSRRSLNVSLIQDSKQVEESGLKPSHALEKIYSQWSTSPNLVPLLNPINTFRFWFHQWNNALIKSESSILSPLRGAT